jgi:alanine-synthesizing transaminase
MVAQANRLKNVRYDIRGPVLRRAQELENAGHNILKLNLGNPAPWGLNAPEPIMADVVHNLPAA